MCGICGAFRIDGGAAPPLSADVLRSMTDEIEYRGPDDAGFVLRDGAALGARRLSIVDVAGGHQPFSDESGNVWAAQNGEIYNHEAIRDDLAAAGHKLHSRCDTEVLPHLWEEHGPGLAEHLRGMFAVAVWDAPARRGVLIRDRLGVKPLYYAIVDGVVVFGSELKCVIASGLIDDTLDPEAIAAYLSIGFVPAPLTPLKQVRKLLPGERLVIGDGMARTERWWTYPAPAADHSVGSAEAWAEIVLAQLDESVRMRLMSDVPLGAMLSGGLDSSLIVALMARHMDRPVETFSVGFTGGDSELPEARRIAAALGAEHHELEIDMQTTPDDLRRLVWHLDEPLADLSSVGFLALSRAREPARHGRAHGPGRGRALRRLPQAPRRVAGGDLAPRPRPRAQRSAPRVGSRGPGRAGRLFEALQAPDPVSRLLGSSELLTADLKAGLFDGALAEQHDAARGLLDRHMQGAPGAAPLEAALYLDAKLGLVDDMLTYFDRCSMACSLEVRVPFLDHEFVELCARIPTGHKVHRLQGKHVLRLAAKGLVPDDVLDAQEARLLQRGGRRLARRRRRRRREGDPARAGARAGARPRHGRRARGGRRLARAATRALRRCCWR